MARDYAAERQRREQRQQQFVEARERAAAAEARLAERESSAAGEGSRERSAPRRNPAPAVVSTAREASGGALAGNMASKVQARKLVLVAVFVLFALNLYHERRGDTKIGFFRRVYATGLVGLFLALLADFAPGIAGPFAALIVLSQIPQKGNDLFLSKLPGGRGGGTAATPAGAPAPVGPGGIVPSPVPGTIPGAGGELRPPTTGG
jgi:hypothetical protein